jgi:hypothetical protein
MFDDRIGSRLDGSRRLADIEFDLHFRPSVRRTSGGPRRLDEFSAGLAAANGRTTERVWKEDGRDIANSWAGYSRDDCG